MAKIIITSGPGKGLTYKIGIGGAILGRQSTNDIPLPDTQASRQHCRIFIENGVYHIQDMASRNGTCVNGKQIDRLALSHQDTIKIGDITMTFLSQEEAPAMSPPLVELELPAAPMQPADSGQQKTRSMPRQSPPSTSPVAQTAIQATSTRTARTGKPGLADKRQRQPFVLFSDLSWYGQLLLALALLALLFFLTWTSRWLTLNLLA